VEINCIPAISGTAVPLARKMVRSDEPAVSKGMPFESGTVVPARVDSSDICQDCGPGGNKLHSGRQWDRGPTGTKMVRSDEPAVSKGTPFASGTMVPARVDSSDIRQDRGPVENKWHSGRQWDRGPTGTKDGQVERSLQYQRHAVRKWDHGPSPWLAAVISVRAEVPEGKNGIPTAAGPRSQWRKDDQVERSQQYYTPCRSEVGPWSQPVAGSSNIRQG